MALTLEFKVEHGVSLTKHYNLQINKLTSLGFKKLFFTSFSYTSSLKVCTQKTAKQCTSFEALHLLKIGLQQVIIIISLLMLVFPLADLLCLLRNGGWKPSKPNTLVKNWILLTVLWAKGHDRNNPQISSRVNVDLTWLFFLCSMM